jgi:hypothetical protein
MGKNDIPELGPRVTEALTEENDHSKQGRTEAVVARGDEAQQDKKVDDHGR